MHCGMEPDTAEHTWWDCVAEANEREELTRWTGRNLSLEEIIKAGVRDADAWTAMTRFAQTVM